MITEPAPVDDADPAYSVDELAAVSGLTVRTTRYYASLGLLPPPERRGRSAYYSEQHRARLDLIRALQDQGFTLAAIERYLDRVPADATVDDLALMRSMLTPWRTGGRELVTRRQLDRRAGRRLSDDDIRRLERFYGIERDGNRFEILPGFQACMRGLDLDVDEETLEVAGTAIARHMDELADELTRVLQERVIAPFRAKERTPEERAEFETTVSQLRTMTLEALVGDFQRAANRVIGRSLSKD